MSGPGRTDRPLVVLDALLVNRRPTGVGRAILELVQALADRDRGYDFLLLVTEPAMFEQVAGAQGWRILPCPAARGGTLRKALFTQFQVPRICSRQGAALLHSMQFVAPLRLSCPSVVTVHDLAYLRFPDTVEEPRRTYYRFLVPRSLDRAATIVTNSRSTADDVAQFFPTASRRVTPTFFGTPSWVWSRETTVVPAAPARPFFLFVGTLEPRKNLERLLEAFELFLAGAAKDSRPEAEVPGLVFIGSKGWKDSSLQGKIRDLKARGKLEVRDYCDTGQLWGYYRTARALLFPSLHEGFGFPILEAMGAGLPVLTSARGAMVEIGGDAVLTVDPDDAGDMARGMAAIAWDSDLRRQLVAAGTHRSRSWSWERTADLTTNVYNDLVRK